MPEITSRQTFTFGSFSGGYNTDTDPLMVPKQFLSQVQNCLYESGWIQKSFGRTLAVGAPPSGTIQLIAEFAHATGALTRDVPEMDHILMVFTTTSVYTVIPQTNTYTDITPPGGLHGTVAFAPTMVTWLNSIFYTNGTDPIVTWDGVAAQASFITSGGAPTTCTDLCVFAGSLFAVCPTTGTGIQEWEIDWSDFRNPYVWNAGAAGGMVLDDTAEPVMCANTVSRWMAVFKTHTIYVITYLGVSPWYDVRRIDAPGVLCRRTLVRLPVLGLFYQGPDDCYTFDGNQPSPIDKPVRKEIIRLLHPAGHDNAVAWVHEPRGRVYLSIPTAADTPDAIYTYSYMDGQFMREARSVLSGGVFRYDDALLVNELVHTVDSYNVQIQDLVRQEINRFLTTDGNTILINQDGILEDNGEAIDASFTTAEVAPGAQQDGSVLPVTVWEIVLVGNPLPGIARVTLHASWGAQEGPYHAPVPLHFTLYGPYLSLQLQSFEYVIPVEITGLYFKVQVENNVLGEAFQIMQIRLRYTVRGRI